MNCRLSTYPIECNFYMGDAVWDNVSPKNVYFTQSYNFNGNVTFPNGIDTCNNAFDRCQLFNGFVTMPLSVKSCVRMFNNCVMYNQPTVIPMAVETCYRMFNNCRSFNAPVITSPACNNYTYMFNGCNNFNQAIMVNGNNADCSHIFDGCNSLDSSIFFANGIINLNHAFCLCSNFNKPVVIPESINKGISVLNMFKNCSNFNAKITFECLEMEEGYGLSNEANHSILANCYKFNQEIVLPKNFTTTNSWQDRRNEVISNVMNDSASVKWYCNLFWKCQEFNSPITILDDQEGFCGALSPLVLLHNNYNADVIIGNNIISVCGLLYSQHNFNSAITLGENIIDMSSMLTSCYAFDKPIEIGDGVLNCRNMLAACLSFNHPVNIPDSAIDCRGVLRSCSNFNSPLKISENAKSIGDILGSCYKFNQILHVPDSVIDNSYFGILGQKNYKSSISVPFLGIKSNWLGYGYDVHDIDRLSIEEKNCVGATIISRDEGYVDTIVRTYNPLRNEYGATSKERYDILQIFNPNLIIVGDSDPYLENEPPHYNDKEYNSPTNLSGLTNTSFYYKDCDSYNQSTTIPNTVYRCDGMFANCLSFNKPVIFEG